jgi:hypothetical protein
MSAEMAGDRKGVCAASSIANVKASPLENIGKKFCGEVTAVSRGRVVMLFARSESTDVRLEDVTITLDGRAVERLRTMPDNVPFQLYVEGIIDGSRECFSPPASGYEEVTCTPFPRPLTLITSTVRPL